MCTASRRYSGKSRMNKTNSNSACSALFYRRRYEACCGSSLLVAHLECSMWLCRMLSGAPRPWLLATLKSSKRDPKIKEIGETLSQGEEKREGVCVVNPAWKSLRFTLPCSVYKGCPRKLYVWLASEQTNRMCTQWQEKQSLSFEPAAERDTTLPGC